MSRLAQVVLAAAALGIAALLSFLLVSTFRDQPPVPAAGRGPVGTFVEAEPRQQVPEVVFHDAAGAERRLSEFQGKVALVNLWATWCPPCVAEMPSLDRLQAELGPEGFVLLALSQDRGGMPVVRKWIEQNELKNVAPYVTDYKTGTALRTGGQLPVSILVDKQGREVGRVLGATEWDTPEMTARIRAVMAE